MSFEYPDTTIQRLADPRGKMSSDPSPHQQVNNVSAQNGSQVVAGCVGGDVYFGSTGELSEETNCLRSFLTISGAHEAQKDTNPKREPGTCEWFLKRFEFSQWRDNQTSSVLWVTADPGCGKSVLCRALVDERLVSLEPDNITICSFFFKDISNEQRSVKHALAALLHQLFSSQKAKHLIENAMPAYKAYGDKLSKDIQQMWKVIERIAADPKSGKIVFLFDALDECEPEKRKQLIRMLQEFHNKRNHQSTGPSYVKFLVTSRPYWDIEREFSDLTKSFPGVHLKGEEQTESIREEIDMVIEARMKDMKFAGLKSRKLLVDHMKKVENRTYLWVHLILDDLSDRSRIDTNIVNHFVNNTPHTLFMVYDAIMKKSKDPSNAKRLLHIVVAASRPLELREVGVALYISNDTSSYDDLEIQEEDDFKEHVKSLCGCFITVRDKKLFLIHQTAKDYLVKLKDAQSPNDGSWMYSLAPVKSNRLLAEICLIYLSFPELEKSSQDIDRNGNEESDKAQVKGYTSKYHLLDYAANNWAFHFRAAEIEEDEENVVLFKLALQICDSQPERSLIWFRIHWTWKSQRWQRFPGGFTPLIIASYFGCNTIVKSLIHKSVSIEGMNNLDQTALHWAAWNGNDAVLKLLIDTGASLDAMDKCNQTALREAVRNRHYKSAKLLVDADAAIDTTDKFNQTVLREAAGIGDVDIVTLLANAGAALEIPDFFGRTALREAARLGHVGVVKVLLDAGASLENMYAEGYTALLEAAGNGDLAMVRMLLDAGAALEVPAPGAVYMLDDACAALEATTGTRHKALVEALQSAGAALRANDLGSLMELRKVAKSKHEDVIKLLNAGADLDTSSQSPSGTVSKLLENVKALSTAPDGAGKEATEKLVRCAVLTRGLKDGVGKTALQEANYYGHKDVVELIEERSVSNLGC